MSHVSTADLCDQLGDSLRVMPPRLRDFGGSTSFHGPITTLRVLEDNALVRTVLSERGAGRVLVIDGGGSVRTALVGGKLGQLAQDNGWSGIVVWGAVRDVEELRACAIGIRALASCPKPPRKTGAGERDVALTLADFPIAPGQWLAADADGIIVSESVPDQFR